MVVRFIEHLFDAAFSTLVKDKEINVKFEELVEDGVSVQNDAFVRHATDVTFQQCNRPTGNIQHSKPHYFEQHKLYGYKVEVSVLGISVALDVTTHYRRSVLDL